MTLYILLVFLFVRESLGYPGKDYDANHWFNQSRSGGDGEWHNCPSTKIEAFNQSEKSYSLPSTRFDMGTCAPTSGDNKHFMSAGITLIGKVGDLATKPLPVFSVMAKIINGIWSSGESQDDYMSKWADCMEQMMNEKIDNMLYAQALAYINHLRGDIESFTTSMENKQYNDAANKISEVSVQTTAILGDFQAANKHENLVTLITDAAVIEAMMRSMFIAGLRENDPAEACSRGESQLIDLRVRQKELYTGSNTIQNYIDSSDMHTKWPNSIEYAGGWCSFVVIYCSGVSWFSVKDTYQNIEDEICVRDCQTGAVGCATWPCIDEEEDHAKYCKEKSDYAKRTYTDLSTDISSGKFFYDDMYDYTEALRHEACNPTTTTTTTTTTTKKPGPSQCSDYYTLDMADRAPVWTEGSEWCDNMESKRTSPDWQGQGWYRVTGEAGDALPDEAPGDWLCGTLAPGWLNGKHPAVEDGEVDRTVCFQYTNDLLGTRNECHWEVDVSVINCGDFFVYNLPGTPDPHSITLRYCGNGR